MPAGMKVLQISQETPFAVSLFVKVTGLCQVLYEVDVKVKIVYGVFNKEHHAK